jgi:hypothetical protein
MLTLLVMSQTVVADELETFTTVKGYHKDNSLLPSGLLGPVTIRTGAWVEVK